MKTGQILASAISITDLTSLLLAAALLFLGFKVWENKWSYRISKPFAWEEAIARGAISSRLLKAERSCRDKVRFYTLWLQVERLRSAMIDGAFAELGVYRGETARMLHLMDPSRRFHLFDTFTGFAPADLQNETLAPENESVDFSGTTEDSVRLFIGGNENLFFHAGYFPESAGTSDENFSLVHLDADLHKPTLAGLRYFYQRLTPGGVIIVHDYNHNWAGVPKAVNEFLLEIPERPSPVADWQGSIVLVKNSRPNHA